MITTSRLALALAPSPTSASHTPHSTLHSPIVLLFALYTLPQAKALLDFNFDLDPFSPLALALCLSLNLSLSISLSFQWPNNPEKKIRKPQKKLFNGTFSTTPKIWIWRIRQARKKRRRTEGENKVKTKLPITVKKNQKQTNTFLLTKIISKNQISL